VAICVEDVGVGKRCVEEDPPAGSPTIPLLLGMRAFCAMELIGVVGTTTGPHDWRTHLGLVKKACDSMIHVLIRRRLWQKINLVS
jgi:hypothetical protein